jgi:hypothetical protein
VAVHASVAGTVLGVPKALTALLSGMCVVGCVKVSLPFSFWPFLCGRQVWIYSARSAMQVGGRA